ncbi:MAG: redoxin domain-containing protein [Deltaproteobacteria bacterium]|nr:redoxin domain-containing protein [Deltaproteobacteria bacterium]MBW2361941.1 redoxin domain-containing protein [Deltaproteobacteria bacterium]
MIRSVAAFAFAVLSALFAVSAPRAEPLEAGAKAPNFTLQGSDGSTYSLSQFVGQRGVVLAWFPMAFTPG